MEICISEHNGKKIIVLLDNEMRIVKPVYDFLRFQQQKGRAINTLKAYGTDWYATPMRDSEKTKLSFIGVFLCQESKN